MSMIPDDAMVVVADGESARVFHNIGRQGVLTLREDETLTAKHLLNDGPSGHQPSEQTGKQTDEATFAKQLANHLNHGALTNLYADLVLIADPQTLGQMRPQLHKETLQRMHAEHAKTLTNSSLHDIEKSLR